MQSSAVVDCAVKSAPSRRVLLSSVDSQAAAAASPFPVVRVWRWPNSTRRDVSCNEQLLSLRVHLRSALTLTPPCTAARRSLVDLCAWRLQRAHSETRRSPLSQPHSKSNRIAVAAAVCRHTGRETGTTAAMRERHLRRESGLVSQWHAARWHRGRAAGGGLTVPVAGPSPSNADVHRPDSETTRAHKLHPIHGFRRSHRLQCSAFIAATHTQPLASASASAWGSQLSDDSGQPWISTTGRPLPSHCFT